MLLSCIAFKPAPISATNVISSVCDDFQFGQSNCF